MPNIPAKLRHYLYAVGVAFVPVAQVYGWVNDSQAAAIVGLAYAVFMGGLAAANTPRGTNADTQ